MFRTGLLFFLFFPAGLFAQAVPYTQPTFSESFFQFESQARERIFTDYSNLYSRSNVKNCGLALLGAGVLANTSWDGDFQHWHNKYIRSDFTDEFSKVSKVFGNGHYFVPAMTASALTYRFLQEWREIPESALGEFTDRTTRGYLVGTPALLLFQVTLGGDRPGDGTSHWRPFREPHGISGHAFMGAVPFITAAQMTDRPCVKGLFYALSTFTGWGRVNDDQHYLSQALLGWYLAYLSVQAVSETEKKRRLPQGLTLFPVTESNAVGAGLIYRY